MGSPSREDTRSDRRKAIREKREKIARASAAWTAARDARREEAEDSAGLVFTSTAGAVSVIRCPVTKDGFDFWVIMVVTAGKVIEYTTRMSEEYAVFESDRLQKKYTGGTELRGGGEIVIPD